MAGNPTFSKFNPRDIPWQYKVKEFMRKHYDYRSNGTLEILLSGSVGSAKSIFGVNMGITHCLMYSDAVLGLFRLAMPDLKETLFATMEEHIYGAEIIIDGHKDYMREGVHYTINNTKASIDFANGAKVRSKSWSDKKWGKLRSHNYSAGLLEEYTESESAVIEKAYDEISTRIGRVSWNNSNVRENWLLGMTNPDGESHHGFDYFMTKANQIILPYNYQHKFTHVPKEHALFGIKKHYKGEVMGGFKSDKESLTNRYFFYSRTEDNPYLDPLYIRALKGRLSPIQYRRKLLGEWVDDQSDKIYSMYDSHFNFKGQDFKVIPGKDIWCSWDFNIGEGKPLSMCAEQYDKSKDTFHAFFESIIEGADTLESLNDCADRGLFDHDCKYFITGDATGRAKSTNNKKSDWDIINKFLANYRRPDGKPFVYEVVVGKSNPPVRTRHNEVNAYLLNANQKRRTFIYNQCPVLEKGMRLTSLKKGGAYIEDDSKSYQHVTTSHGYLICSANKQYEHDDFNRSQYKR